jgi:branched-chain amino acid aminotransferase
VTRKLTNLADRVYPTSVVCNPTGNRARNPDSLASAMSVEEIISIDGSISPTAEAVVPVKDDGLYRGDGVFEVTRLYGGVPYVLDEHLDRLERSASQIELPIERAALESEIEALVAAHGDADAQLRIVITRGGRRIAAVEPLPNLAPAVSLASVTYQPTVILTGAKTLSYGANMQATRLAAAKDADEAVLVTPDGTVMEPPTSTVFWVSDSGSLRTPALDVGILDSITRRKLIEQLEDVEEGSFPLDDLLGANEAFLASSVREVQPVSAVDGHELDRHGPRTQAARAAFDSLIADWRASLP